MIIKLILGIIIMTPLHLYIFRPVINELFNKEEKYVEKNIISLQFLVEFALLVVLYDLFFRYFSFYFGV